MMKKNIAKPPTKKIGKIYKNYGANKFCIYFLISYGNYREFTESGLELVDLLKENNIKIILVTNGPINVANKKIL